MLFIMATFFAFMLYVSSTDKGTIAFCLLGSGVLAVFWPVVSKIDSLKFGPTGVELTKRVDEANAKADDAASKAYGALATITRFVFNSMPQPSFRNLEKIASGHFGKFRMSEGFRQELRNLRDSGYIATNSIYIGQIPEEGPDLSDYVYCTELGKEFISQRLAAEAAARRNTVQNF
jgi:hypothetical protein